MKRSLHRLRGAVGMGLAWAVAWSPIGAVVGLVVGVVVGEVALGVVAIYVWYFAALGFVNGVMFRYFTLLKISKEGEGRGFDEMSFPTVVFMGGTLVGCSLAAFFLSNGDPLSAFLLSIGDPPTLRWLVIGLAALLGAGSAAGSLALARRAEEVELLELGGGPLGLIEGG